MATSLDKSKQMDQAGLAYKMADLDVSGNAEILGTFRGAVPVAGGSTLTLTAASHAGKTIKLDTLAGTVVTLPAATGTGDIYKFLVSVLATSNSHIVKVASAADIIQGTVLVVDTDTAGTVTGFATASDSDTITLNRSTTGSAMRGEWLEIQDIASGVFVVTGVLANTGNGATPFSAAV